MKIEKLKKDQTGRYELADLKRKDRRRLMKLTDNEIIKGLQCCIKVETESDCAEYGCPYYPEKDCLKKNGEDILNLISRQNEEIGRLEEILGGTSKVLTATCAGVRIKARKEFAEKIKEKNGNDFLRSWYEGADECYEFNQEAFEAFIDSLVEEMERENDK